MDRVLLCEKKNLFYSLLWTFFCLLFEIMALKSCIMVDQEL